MQIVLYIVDSTTGVCVVEFLQSVFHLDICTFETVAAAYSFNWHCVVGSMSLITDVLVSVGD